ncbi:hypothetical protein TSUD_135390 [Trifolium subterraneum]|uniref:Uncharacterized protein n=1 Tax=Trifolium subterraneum TaxID=3900 RepID=A0A2Z6PIM6_TRISU|nr:hypothetical protein TSUD_135390 [Trifolium subterraneum]
MMQALMSEVSSPTNQNSIALTGIADVSVIDILSVSQSANQNSIALTGTADVSVSDILSVSQSANQNSIVSEFDSADWDS